MTSSTWRVQIRRRKVPVLFSLWTSRGVIMQQTNRVNRMRAVKFVVCRGHTRNARAAKRWGNRKGDGQTEQRGLPRGGQKRDHEATERGTSTKQAEGNSAVAVYTAFSDQVITRNALFSCSLSLSAPRSLSLSLPFSLSCRATPSTSIT